MFAQGMEGQLIWGVLSTQFIHAFLTAKVQDRWQHVANMNQMNQKVRTGCGMWNIKGP